MLSFGSTDMYKGLPKSLDDKSFLRRDLVKELKWDVLSATCGDQEKYQSQLKKRLKLVKHLQASSRHVRFSTTPC